jgi:predicted NACHT family NTPase
MERSLAACPQGIALAKKALISTGLSVMDFANKVNVGSAEYPKPISKQTIEKFFAGGKVDRTYFVGICKALDLDWEVVVGSKNWPTQHIPLSSFKDIEAVQGAENDKASQRAKDDEAAEEMRAQNVRKAEDTNKAVQRIRDQCRPSIEKLCGTMRVLAMAQPVGVNSIYTTVNILEKITSNKHLDISELVANCGAEDFDRFSLGKVKEVRVPGLDAVQRWRKLMIWGKPGAGKTTFLKYLAMNCISGKFQSQQLPIFVTLKDFAESPNQPTLMEYLQQLIQADESRIQCISSRHDIPSLDLPLVGKGLNENIRDFNTLLQDGRALILLDGLDEVRDNDHDRVLKDIRLFEHGSMGRENQIVITCRIAARDYIFESFTDVEIADFDQNQINEFVNKWFLLKDPAKAHNFLTKIENHKPIQELSSRPLLLTLLCLEFEESGDFPANRSELYDRGIQVLLSKWDASRNIERDDAYKKISLKRKEDLLSSIAFRAFTKNEYFFKQRALEEQISSYISNLPKASKDSTILLLDSQAILKAIESHHGLLVARAIGVYSFSHLTFQEYFAARYIEKSKNGKLLPELVRHLSDRSWREVFLLTSQMLENADELFLSMKLEVDRTIVDDEKIQKFLMWLHRKTTSVKGLFNKRNIRQYYFSNDCSVLREFNHDRRFHRKKYLYSVDDIERAKYSDIDLDLYLYICLYTDLNLCVDGDVSELLKCTLNASKKDDSSLFDELELLFNSALHTSMFNRTLHVSNDWKIKLRELMIEYRDIGYDWQFDNDQEKLLRIYIEANELLADCLNSECYTSCEVREEIEATTYLPMIETEKWREEHPRS